MLAAASTPRRVLSRAPKSWGRAKNERAGAAGTRRTSRTSAPAETAERAQRGRAIEAGARGETLLPRCLRIGGVVEASLAARCDGSGFEGIGEGGGSAGKLLEGRTPRAAPGKTRGLDRGGGESVSLLKE